MAAQAVLGSPVAQRAARLGSQMVISRTPLRISFVGGGTDIPEYYRANGGGAVVNAAVNKHVHIVVAKKFDDQVRVSYSQTEIVDNAEMVRHPLVREALKLLGIDRGVEIVSISDIPSHGTGLGSSSAFTVGLLHALHAWLGESPTPQQLAEEAIMIERDIVRDPGGVQDQYIAAYGGLRFMQFHSDARVDVQSIDMDEKDWVALQDSLLLFYTGRGRAGSPILAGQINQMHAHWADYTAIRNLAYALYDDLRNGRTDRLGVYLHENWERKRRLSTAISNPELDALYERARAAGATGGKITGAGGGGFLLLSAPAEKRASIREALSDLKEETFCFDRAGSQIVYVGR